MAPYEPRSHWSKVGQRILARGDRNLLAGDDAPYYRYKGKLFNSEFLPEIPVEGRSVLDVGCGAGGSLGGLRGRGASRLAGCDQAPGMVDVAKQNVPEADITLIDGRTLPYKDGEFDIVMTVTVLQHNPDARRAKLIEEICRVSKQFVFLFEDTEDSDIAREEGTGAYGNFYGQPVSWYKQECLRSGFKLIKSRSLSTQVSLRTFNILRRYLSRGRQEGEPFSPMHLAIERMTLPITRRLDKHARPGNWELTEMKFEKS